MHQITGRWKLGLTLALITALMWGLLPIAIKELLKTMDPWTITFYRFVGAAVVMGVYLYKKNDLPVARDFNFSNSKLLLICILGLCANYIFFLFGLDLTTAATTQVLIQLAPMLLLFGSLTIFKESFSGIQWTGFFIFFVGLLLFFNRKLESLLYFGEQYTVGVFYIILASITWAFYALAQKQLLKTFSSIKIMFIILVVGSFGFYPEAHPGQFFDLDNLGIGMLVFSSLNTAIAYGAFAEAMNHWEASRVSAVLSITPIITVISMSILASVYSSYFSLEPLSLLTILGILTVVAGSSLTALGKRKILKSAS